ncbi:MAG: hypothetical protein JW924_00775 [Fusobacteriaceae bacterium]|nr:hypothetical protein [Fusobacteriaceae bacterium]
MIKFWNLLTLDQKLDLLKQVIPVISIVIGATISIIIFALTKRKEINFKIHEQRKKKYEECLNFYQKIFSNNSFDIEEFIRLQQELYLYGSNKVLLKIIEMNEIGKGNQINRNDILLVLFGQLLQLMREEIGLTNKQISIRDSLSLFVTDVYDEKYESLFK